MSTPIRVAEPAPFRIFAIIIANQTVDNENLLSAIVYVARVTHVRLEAHQFDRFISKLMQGLHVDRFGSRRPPGPGASIDRNLARIARVELMQLYEYRGARGSNPWTVSAAYGVPDIGAAKPPGLPT